MVRPFGWKCRIRFFVRQCGELLYAFLLLDTRMNLDNQRQIYPQVLLGLNALRIGEMRVQVEGIIRTLIPVTGVPGICIYPDL
jgi:hypothetical protein